MTVLKWPDAFEWPYAGQPTDIPPQFARSMVKIEDQIYWLLNAVKLLNANAISMAALVEYADEADTETLKKAKAYADDAVSNFNEQLNDLEEIVTALNSQIAITRNPITGMNTTIYVAIKQMYDMLRPHAVTWNELEEMFDSWADLNSWSIENDYSYYDFEMFANIIKNNSDKHRLFYTPEVNIDNYTPGYYPDIFVHGDTWEELKEHGFLYSRTGD